MPKTFLPFCTHCGSPNESDGPYCVQCGIASARPDQNDAVPASGPPEGPARNRRLWPIPIILIATAIAGAGLWYVGSQKSQSTEGGVPTSTASAQADPSASATRSVPSPVAAPKSERTVNGKPYTGTIDGLKGDFTFKMTLKQEADADVTGFVRQYHGPTAGADEGELAGTEEVSGTWTGPRKLELRTERWVPSSAPNAWSERDEVWRLRFTDRARNRFTGKYECLVADCATGPRDLFGSR